MMPSPPIIVSAPFTSSFDAVAAVVVGRLGTEAAGRNVVNLLMATEWSRYESGKAEAKAGSADDEKEEEEVGGGGGGNKLVAR